MAPCKAKPGLAGMAWRAWTGGHGLEDHGLAGMDWRTMDLPTLCAVMRQSSDLEELEPDYQIVEAVCCANEGSAGILSHIVNLSGCMGNVLHVVGDLR